MNGVRFLVLALAVGRVLAFPAAALGQPVSGHLSRVVVMIDGERVAKTMTMEGVALIRIPGTGATTGKEIHYMVGDMMADEVDTWEQGGHSDKDFEVSITTGATPIPVPPHLSRLLVSIDGFPAPDGSVVTAWMDGAAVATALTASGAAYVKIEGDGSDSGKAISFRIEVLTGE